MREEVKALGEEVRGDKELHYAGIVSSQSEEEASIGG